MCYTNSSLTISGIYTYISLRFTQSNSPTHTKSLFNFRNTRISRISRQYVSASSCKTSAHRENTFHLGLWCRCSKKFFGHCGNQWMDCFRRWWHLLLTDKPKVRVGIDQCVDFQLSIVAQVLGLREWHRRRLVSVIIECCQLSQNNQMEAMRCRIFENDFV